MAPHEPVLLCTATPSTLMYVDYFKYPQVIHRLDLSDAHPKPTFGKSVIHGELDREPGLFRDLCFVKDGDKELLVVVDEVNGVFAYNTETGKLERKVDAAAPRMKYGMCPVGVTTDERGHLYVSDWKNECIQMFSVSDGLYMGYLLKYWEIAGNPEAIRWCITSSSLVLNVMVKGKLHLKVINVQIR